MVSSCRTSERAVENICPEHTDTLYRRSHPVNQTCSGMSVTITSGCLWRCAPTLVWGRAFKSMSACVHICVCLWESRVDATSIFSRVHWVLPLCYAALFLGQAAGSSAAAAAEAAEHRDSSSSAPWPRPSSSYISGRDLQDSSAVFRGGYLQKKETLSWQMPCSSTSFSLRWLIG